MSATNFFRSRSFLALSILGTAIIFYFLIISPNLNSGNNHSYKLPILDSTTYVKETLTQYFASSSSVLTNVAYASGKANVVFTDNKGHAYFDNNSRIKEIISIESFKYFYKLPFVNEINYVFNLPEGTQNYSVKREKLESLFGVQLNEIRECRANIIFLGDKWSRSMRGYIESSNKIDAICQQLN